ncbi:MAG: hypothetical protein RXP99_00150, partial [Vulcanisaeta sp.]
MFINYRVRPRFYIRFSLPIHPFLFIGFLLVSPLLLFVFLVLISIGLEPIIALTLTLGSLLTSYVNIVIAEVTFYESLTPLIEFMKLLP